MFTVIDLNRLEINIWQIFDPYSEKRLKRSSSGVAEFNGDVRILTGSSELASAHAQ